MYGNVDSTVESANLKQFIDQNGMSASHTNAFLNNFESLTGYLAMNDIPNSYSATLSTGNLTSNGSFDFQTQGSAQVASFTPGSTNTINSLYVDSEFQDANNSQGVYMWTVGGGQGLATSNSLIGSTIFPSSANIADFGEFGFTYNLYSLGSLNAPVDQMVNDRPVAGAIMVFEFCSNITTDPTTGQPTNMSNCVDMKVRTPNADIYKNYLSADLPVISNTYTVDNPQQKNVIASTQSLTTINQNSGNTDPLWTNIIVSKYLTRSIQVDDIT